MIDHLLTATSVALLLLRLEAPLSLTIRIGAAAWLAARFYKIKQPILEKCLLALIVLYPFNICIIQSSYWLAGLQS